jgi:hypothetical protein
MVTNSRSLYLYSDFGCDMLAVQRCPTLSAVRCPQLASEAENLRLAQFTLHSILFKGISRLKTYNKFSASSDRQILAVLRHPEIGIDNL